MRMHGGGFCFHYLFVYNLCRHILYTTGPERAHRATRLRRSWCAPAVPDRVVMLKGDVSRETSPFTPSLYAIIPLRKDVSPMSLSSFLRTGLCLLSCLSAFSFLPAASLAGPSARIVVISDLHYPT